MTTAIRLTTLVAEISTTLQRIETLESRTNGDSSQARETLETLIAMMPSGSGIDCGTKLNGEKSNANHLVFIVDYHHMDEWGGYCGWNTYEITVKPTFNGINIDGECEDAWEIEDTIDYLCDTYHHQLTVPIEHSWNGEKSEYTDVELRQA